MIIYLDSDYKCHTSDDGTMRAVEIEAQGKLGCTFFDNKCPEFIEAYRYVPSGEEWTREDGEVFNGEMFSPWNLTDEVLETQRIYEHNLLTVYSAQLIELDKQYVDLMYNHALLELGLTEGEV